MDEKTLKLIYNAKRSRPDKAGRILAGFQQTSFETFNAWFKPEQFEKGCYYCGLTNSQSLKLFEHRPEATRGGRRGKRLELDRLDPYQPYDNIDNLVWCCYWCNNAKSNFFSAEEFFPIAKQMGSKLQEILCKINP